MGNQFNPGSASRAEVLDRSTSFANVFDRFKSSVMEDQRGHEFFSKSSHLVQRPTLQRPQLGRGSLYSHDHSATDQLAESSLALMSHPHSWPGSCTAPSQKTQALDLRGPEGGNDNVHSVDYLSSLQSRLNDTPGDGLQLDLTMSTWSASSEAENKTSEKTVELDLTLDLTMSTR